MARVLALLILVLASAGNALETYAKDEASVVLAQLATDEGGRTATLQLHSRPIFVFRSDFASYSPKERADASARRIDDQLHKGGPGEVGFTDAPEGNVILVDGERVFIITPNDVNVLGGDDLNSLTNRTVETLRLAIAEVHELRNMDSLVRSGGLVLLASLFYFGAIRLMVGVTRKLRVWLADKLGSRVEKLKIAGMPAIDPKRLRQTTEASVTVLLWALTIVITYTWITYIMLQFPVTRAWGEQSKDFLLETIKEVLWAMLGAIPDLVTVIVIVLIARFMVHLSRMFFERIEQGSAYVRWIDRDTARPTRKIATVVIWLFALAMAYPFLPGAQTDAFKGVSVLVGLMVSIGASSVVGQAASGLVLMYSRAFRQGEYVRIGENEGTVRELGMFATRLATVTGQELVVPNSHVLTHTTQNISRMAAGGYAIDTTVTIGYDTPWRQVQALLKLAAERTPTLRKFPAPYVIQTALSDFYVEYRLVARADADQPRPLVLSELHSHILDAFNEHGVQIMSPHYLGDPQGLKVVPETDWYAAPAKAPETKEGSVEK